ncbi:MAG: hypothetical protein KAI24_16660 [Planctomycetes bacterium]|nr:hypothetical protein [Planctomycetota bacterium]
MPGHSRNDDDATAFREAISQWQLAARTEVKRSSSLPSTMFDACDPKLEARLAETVDAMMHCLHQPDTAELAKEYANAKLEQRVENVSADELRALPKLVRDDLAEADLDDNVSSEYLNLLIDTCTTGDEESQHAARLLLSKDFAIESHAALDAAARALFDCLQNVLGSQSETEEQQQQLFELCGAIAATIVVHPQQEAQP